MACVWGGQTSDQVDSSTLRLGDAHATWPFLILSALLLTVLALLEWQAGSSTPTARVPLTPDLTQSRSTF